MVICPDHEPAFRFLIDIETAANFDEPAVVQPDLSVVNNITELPGKLNAVFLKAFLEMGEFFFHLALLVLAVGSGCQFYGFCRANLYYQLTEPYQVQYLMLAADVGVFNGNFPGSSQMSAED